MCSQYSFKKLSNYIFISLIFLGLLGQIGCASGGYKLTRKYSGFVNRQNIIIRIVLYILTSVVFVATLLIDSVIFNTLDFWEGRVSANEYSFEKEGKQYLVRHFYKGEEQLRNTEIRVISTKNSTNQIQQKVILLAENLNGKIEVFEDGKSKALIENLSELSKIKVTENGKVRTQSWKDLYALTLKERIKKFRPQS